MTALAAYSSGAHALLNRDFRIFASYRVRFITQTLGTFFSLVLFYYISRLVGVSSVGSSDGYFAYVVVGLVVMTSLVSTLAALPARLQQELVAGTFERILLSPLGPLAAVGGMMLFPSLLAIVDGILSVTFAALVFDMPVASTAPLAIPAALLAALTFAPFALLAAAAVLVAKQAQGLIGFALTGISLISGAFFPPELLPSEVRWTGDVQPFTPAIQLLRHLISGTAMDQSAGVAILKLVVFSAIFVPIGVWALGAAIRLGQRRGTIIEY